MRSGIACDDSPNLLLLPAQGQRLAGVVGHNRPSVARSRLLPGLKLVEEECDDLTTKVLAALVKPTGAWKPST